MDKSLLKRGCVNIYIDELVPCLEDLETGEVKDTVVFKIESRSYLRSFNEDNGWYINWYDLPRDVEVYALAIKDTSEIQGLVGIKNDSRAHAAYLHWACVAPHNNKHDFGTCKYSGVGGHLFAVAADKSVKWGYNGLVLGIAADEKRLKHYNEVFGAEHIGIIHRYHFIIDDVAAQKLLEVYSYEWNEG